MDKSKWCFEKTILQKFDALNRSSLAAPVPKSKDSPEEN